MFLIMIPTIYGTVQFVHESVCQTTNTYSDYIKHNMETHIPQTTQPNVQKPMNRFIIPAAVVGATVVVGVLAAPLVVPAALGTVGFSSTGVVGGSIAAGMQASIGNVAAGSAFAACQSMAMGGAIAPVATAASGTAGGVLGIVGTGLTSLFRRRKQKKEKNEGESNSEEVKEEICDTSIYFDVDVALQRPCLDWKVEMPYMLLFDDTRKRVHPVNRHYGPLGYDANRGRIEWMYPDHNRCMYMYGQPDTDDSKEAYLQRYHEATRGYIVITQGFAINDKFSDAKSKWLDGMLRARLNAQKSESLNA